MKIIIGSGNKRRVALELPCAAIVKRSPPEQQQQVSGILCQILGVKHKVEVSHA